MGALPSWGDRRREFLKRGVLAPDRNLRAVEVDVGPVEAQSFAAAHPHLPQGEPQDVELI